MFDLLNQLKAIRAAWDAGNYEEAGRLVYELVGNLLGYRGRLAAGAVGDDQLDECEAEAEGLAAAVSATKVPKGAKAAVGAGGVELAILLIQTLAPIIVAWIERRRQGTV